MLSFQFFKALGSKYSRLHQRLPKSFKAAAIISMRLPIILNMLNFQFFKALGSTYSHLHQRLPKSFEAAAIIPYYHFDKD